MRLDPSVVDFLSRKDICLVGFMGAGKSFIGEHLASELGLPVVDTDILVEAQAQIPIADIFKKLGERHFRGVEKVVLENIVYGDCEQKRVICTGGGLPVSPANRKLIKLLGSINICLNPPFETIYERIKGSKRPLVYRRSRKYIFSLWAARYVQYQKIAHITISETTLDGVFKAINERVKYLSQ